MDISPGPNEEIEQVDTTETVIETEESTATPEEPTFEDHMAQAFDQEVEGDQQVETSEEEPPQADASPAAEDVDAETSAESDDEGLEDVDPSEEDLAGYHPKTRKQIERLLNQRRELGDAKVQLEREAEFLKPFKEFAQTHPQMTQQDMQSILALSATWANKDYASFLKAVVPYVQYAQQSMGLALPKDLKEQVDTGRITQAYARELTQRRMQSQELSAQNERMAQERQVQAQQAHAQALAQVVDSWEATVRQKDPDYAKKEDVVKRFCLAEFQQRGIPQTQEQALQIVEAAYAEANKYIASLQPAPRPVSRAPEGVHSPQPGKNAPASMEEAMLQALS